MVPRGEEYDAYTLEPTMSEWADYAVKPWCGNPSGERPHTQLERERSSIVISGR